MRKSLLSIGMFVALFGASNTYAQLSKGGVPMSKQQGITLTVQPTPMSYTNPLGTQEAIDQARLENESSVNFLVAKFAETDLSFPESGVFEYLDNGSIVWRAQLVIPNAPAIGTYFDKFDLPSGVQMFIFNENGNQILGAFTEENVSQEDKLFAVEPIQGNYVNIELNIANNVDLNSIQLHIDKAAVYFEGISYLAQYADPNDDSRYLEIDRFRLQGSGSPCHKNAACVESDFDVARRATIQTLYVGGRGLSMCSAALINSYGNTETNCKNYVITASHCQSNADGFGEFSNAAFSQTIFRFNFEVPECESTSIAEVNTMTGANFISRSPYSDTLIGGHDFLLLQLRDRAPRSFNAMQAGWDITAQQNSGRKYVGFHHPSGDIKKASWHDQIINSFINIRMTFADDGSRGSIAGGSSGSALFNPDNNIIGIASTGAATQTLPGCPRTSPWINYYRFSSGYNFNPAIANQNMKVWLDPGNTGVTRVNATTTYCDGAVSVVEAKTSELDNKVNFYPNPSTSGIVQVKFDFAERQNVTLEIFNMLGAKVGEVQLDNIGNGNYPLNMSELASGIYMIKTSTGTESVTKKVTIAK